MHLCSTEVFLCIRFLAIKTFQSTDDLIRNLWYGFPFVMAFQKCSSVHDPLNRQTGASRRTVGYNMRQEGKAVRDGGDRLFLSQRHCQRQHGTVVILLWTRIKCPLLRSSLLHSPPEVIPLVIFRIVIIKDEVCFLDASFIP